MRGADAQRDFQPRGLAVDRNDRLGAGEPRAEHAAQAHAAQAKHGNRISRTDARRVDYGSDSGHHRAAEQRRISQRHVAIDHHDGASIDDRVLGHARHAAVMTDPLTVRAGDAAPARHQLTGGFRSACALADLRPAFQTTPAAAARRRELEHHVVPYSHVVDRRAHLDDFSGPFVTQSQRNRAGTIAVDHRQVRVTQPGAGDANQQLHRLRRRERDFLDR
jgi:hypothetical protein